MVMRKRPQINEEFSPRCDDGFIGDQGRSASCGRYSNSACGTTIAITRKLSFKQLFLNPHLLPFSTITYLRYRQISITHIKKRRVVLRKRPQINEEFHPRCDDGIMGDQGRSASCGRYSNSASGTSITTTCKLSLNSYF